MIFASGGELSPLGQVLWIFLGRGLALGQCDTHLIIFV